MENEGFRHNRLARIAINHPLDHASRLKSGEGFAPGIPAKAQRRLNLGDVRHRAIPEAKQVSGDALGRKRQV